MFHFFFSSFSFSSALLEDAVCLLRFACRFSCSYMRIFGCAHLVILRLHIVLNFATTRLIRKTHRGCVPHDFVTINTFPLTRKLLDTSRRRAQRNCPGKSQNRARYNWNVRSSCGTTRRNTNKSATRYGRRSQTRSLPLPHSANLMVRIFFNGGLSSVVVPRASRYGCSAVSVSASSTATIASDASSGS